MIPLAQTLTAGAQAIADSIGWGGLAGIGATILGIVLAYLRGVRFLAPVVAAIEWFRSHGARSLDLTGFGLSLEQQEALRARVQAWLWDSLRDAVATFADGLGLLKALDAKVQAITGPLKVGNQGGRAVVPPLQGDAIDQVRKTTGVMAAFKPEAGPPELGRAHLGALMLAALLALLLPACVSLESKHAAERLAATARVIEAAASSHDVFAAMSPADAAAALDGFRGLAHEHAGYAADLVAATGGDPAEVDRLEAEWRATARAKAAARRVAAAAITGTAVPR